MSERPAYLPGDHLPAITIPDAAGQPYALMHQAIAGLHRILILGREPSPAALAAAEAPLRHREAMLILVRNGQPDGARRSGGPVRVFDPQGQLGAVLGLPSGGVAVISPRGRLSLSLRGATPDEGLRDALATLPEPVEPPVFRSGAPVLIVPDVLEPDLVAALLRHWEAGEKQRDRVAASSGGQVDAPSIKRRADVMLDDRALHAAFQARIERRVIPEMARATRFRAVSFELPRIGCYDAADAGGFGAHRDNRTPTTAHRRFAMSLNLNTGDYEGGQVRFAEFGPELYEPPKGGAVIFCCDLLHEALPVTRGRRFAIFTFFTDAEGSAQEKRLIEEHRAKGFTGVTLR
ncbi:2OG-Fe(II) oxygenase family protein [Roseomonas sp. CCTCC AB2023176]|uniref:2OG-Fe(II) oxygenase family protein n=1 Tax=Roseomonas sp. CCTCC AB2023176 TaxID=3342640 RepID=UPI0035D9BFC3